MSNPNGSGLRAARPTIAIAGQDVPALGDGLLGLTIDENTNGLYRCEALFGNWGNKDSEIDYLYFDRRQIDFGKALQVKIGRDVIFDGRIMGIEGIFPEGSGARKINVLAEDRFQDLRMTRRTRTFADLSDADLMGQIARDHGLRPEIDVTGPTHKVLGQVNQSDLAFMRDRARAIDAELWMDGSTLHVQSRDRRRGGTKPMTYKKELYEFSALADLAGQRTSIAVSGWDVAGKSALRHEAMESILRGELNGDISGVSILRSAIGERKEAIAHTVPLTSQEVQREAESFFKMTARRFVIGRGSAEGDAQLRVGAFVDLLGLGPLFNGKYYLTEVRHIFSGARGLLTEFVGERPGLGQAGR